MIYIYCIRYSREVGIYVLAVGDDVAASSGVAARGNARETHADRLSNGPMNSKAGTAGYCLGTPGTPVDQLADLRG